MGEGSGLRLMFIMEYLRVIGGDNSPGSLCGVHCGRTLIASRVLLFQKPPCSSLDPCSLPINVVVGGVSYSILRVTISYSCLC